MRVRSSQSLTSLQKNNYSSSGYRQRASPSPKIVDHSSNQGMQSSKLISVFGPPPMHQSKANVNVGISSTRLNTAPPASEDRQKYPSSHYPVVLPSASMFQAPSENSSHWKQRCEQLSAELESKKLAYANQLRLFQKQLEQHKHQTASRPHDQQLVDTLLAQLTEADVQLKTLKAQLLLTVNFLDEFATFFQKSTHSATTTNLSHSNRSKPPRSQGEFAGRLNTLRSELKRYITGDAITQPKVKLYSIQNIAQSSPPVHATKMLQNEDKRLLLPLTEEEEEMYIPPETKRVLEKILVCRRSESKFDGTLSGRQSLSQKKEEEEEEENADSAFEFNDTFQQLIDMSGECPEQNVNMKDSKQKCQGNDSMKRLANSNRKLGSKNSIISGRTSQNNDDSGKRSKDERLEYAFAGLSPIQPNSETNRVTSAAQDSSLGFSKSNFWEKTSDVEGDKEDDCRETRCYSMQHRLLSSKVAAAATKKKINEGDAIHTKPPIDSSNKENRNPNNRISQRTLAQHPPSAKEHLLDSAHLSNDQKISMTEIKNLVTAEPKHQTNNNKNIAEALFDFAAKKDGDLSFARGDRITVMKETKDGWWIGMVKKQVGYFPFNFVRYLDRKD